jgi:hypothetical protein
VGFASGKGEGSRPELRQSRGGGGSGNQDPKPVQQGTIAQPSEIPAPINPPLPNPALPLAGIDIDPALWKSMPAAVFGDLRSKSTVARGSEMVAESAMETDWEMETRWKRVGQGKTAISAAGRRIRRGGPSGAIAATIHGRNFVFPPNRESTTESAGGTWAGYTEEARKSAITGIAVLRDFFQFRATGISAKVAPDGLTRRRLPRVRKRLVLPAVKDGHPVSVICSWSTCSICIEGGCVTAKPEESNPPTQSQVKTKTPSADCRSQERSAYFFAKKSA